MKPWQPFFFIDSTGRAVVPARADLREAGEVATWAILRMMAAKDNR